MKMIVSIQRHMSVDNKCELLGTLMSKDGNKFVCVGEQSFVEHIIDDEPSIIL